MDPVLRVHAPGEVFEVDLVDDPDARWHDLERIEGLHAPFHELVAFPVALELQLHVEVERVPGAVVVDLHRMVNDQVDRDQRLDRFGVLAHLAGYPAHRREIGEQRYAGEVLQHDARHHERDFFSAGGVRLPVGELPHMVFCDFLPVAVAQHGLQHDPDRDRIPAFSSAGSE